MMEKLVSFERSVQRGYCQWCPQGCATRLPRKTRLTQEERDGCVASEGFASEWVESIRNMLSEGTDCDGYSWTEYINGGNNGA